MAPVWRSPPPVLRRNISELTFDVHVSGSYIPLAHRLKSLRTVHLTRLTSVVDIHINDPNTFAENRFAFPERGPVHIDFDLRWVTPRPVLHGTRQLK